MVNNVNSIPHRHRKIGLKIVLSLILMTAMLYAYVGIWKMRRRPAFDINLCYSVAISKLLEDKDYHRHVEESGYLCRAFTNRNARWLVVYEKAPDRRKKRRIVFGTNYENLSYREVDEKTWRFLERILNGCVPEVGSQTSRTSVGIQADSTSKKAPQNKGESGADVGSEEIRHPDNEARNE